MKAMILAAGLGTRLFPLTVDRTKPAIPFLGRPVIGYVAEYLASFGISDVVVNLHHQPQSVREALGDGTPFGVKISYVEETAEILGTAGALANARALLGEEPFVVVNGKIVTDIDLSAAIAAHRSAGAMATMVLKENLLRERFTEVLVEGGRVKGFGGMPADAGAAGPAPLMFTGIQILEPSVFEFIPASGASDIIDVFYRPALSGGKTILAHVGTGEWQELSTTKRYLDVNLSMSQGGDVIASEDVTIAPDARVTNCVLWERASIREGCVLNRVIVGEGVVVPPGSSFSNVAIVRGDLVRESGEMPEKAAPGRFEGDNYIVPLT